MGWGTSSETVASREQVRPRSGREAGLGHAGGTRNLVDRAYLKGFAPHILVLYREVPYILYISVSLK